MAISRTADVDDDGSGTTGTIRNNAWKTALYDQIDAALALDPAPPGVSAPTTTGTQTALAIPAGIGDLVLYLNNASLLTIQGIAAGLSGQRLTVFSKGAGQVDFAHLHASGTALGKLKLFATVGLTSLAAGSGAAVFTYDATITQWRLETHDQGAAIGRTFAAGDYTASASMTWTVDAGDIRALTYWLRGRILAVNFNIVSTTVGGTLSNQLNIKIPGGYAAAIYARGSCLVNDNGTNQSGMYDINTAATTIGLLRPDTANFAASTNNTQVFGVAIFEVQ